MIRRPNLFRAPLCIGVVPQSGVLFLWEPHTVTLVDTTAWDVMTKTAQKTFIVSIPVCLRIFVSRRNHRPCLNSIEQDSTFFERFPLRCLNSLLTSISLTVETMQWTHPYTVGDLPTPCCAHTATLYDRKLLIYGGGLALPTLMPFTFDTTTRKWTRPNIASGHRPASTSPFRCFL